MEQIVITHPNGTTLHLQSRERPSVISKATQKVALLSDDLVSLTVVSAEPLSFDFGDTITVFGKAYKLNQLPEPTKEGLRRFTYELTLEGVQYDLIDVIYKLPEGCYGEQLYGDLQAHMTALLWNINRIYPNKWVLGTVPTGTPYKNLNAAGKNCLQALQEYCSEFNVEFEVVFNATNNTYTLNIKNRVGGTFTRTLRYGRGKGLYKLQRKNVNNAGITTRLYAYGSGNNLGNSYGHNKLCLHGTTRLTSYVEDATSKARYGVKENEKTFEDIKPERVGSVTAIASGNVLKFYDSTMFDLNAKRQDGSTIYLIPDTTAKITFQTGGLAGYSFDVHSYNHTTHEFVINKFQDENGLVFPNESNAAFQIAVGDQYIIEDINLPSQYITDAEARLLERAQEELAKVCQPQVSYALELDQDFFIKVFGREVPTEVLHVGDAIHIIDEQIGVDKEIRITRIERDLLKPHAYTVQLSDTVTKTTSTRILNELEEIHEVIYNNGLADPATARRRWKTAQELLSMVFDPEGDYYTDRIKPLSIDTSMLSVGSKSQQFVLLNILFEPNYNGDYTKLHISAGTMAHYALDPDNILTRAMPEATFTLDTSSAYYIYASWQRGGTGTSWLVTTSQLRVDADSDEWLFLVGTVSSPIPTANDQTRKVRSVLLTYGFSTVNGRYIRTGRIESTAGSCYFDLDNNEIGGVIKFVRSDGTIGNLSDTEDKTNDTKDYIDNTLPGILDDIQAQLDGQIEQFFYDYDPDDTSEPTATWIATDTAAGNNNEKEAHLGDLFYNTDSGKVFRYVKILTIIPPPSPGLVPGRRWVYQWQELADAELAEALQLANDALDLAGEKRRIFVSQPTTPYEVGDLWVQGSTGDIMRCKTARSSGNYNASDWEKASKYTDDTALTTFINGNFANTVSTLTQQIDGKIESFWSASDPSTAWNTDALKVAHEGDMWYKTTDKTLWRWVVVYNGTTGAFQSASWQKIEDQKAIDAYAAAQTAQDTADHKRRVFVAQPYAPYDVGDLWLTGDNTNGKLKRCINSRAEGATPTYLAADWVEAVYYDNTKTTIDGGLITSGTVQLVSPVSESIVAGITGGETENANTSAANKVRIWAGASKANRFSAPFRVLQDGTLHATKAVIEGSVKATSGEFTGTVHATDGEFNGNINIGNGKIVLNKDGSGSLANAGLSWTDQGILQASWIVMGSCWGFSRHVGTASQYTAINRESSLVFFDIPDNETVYLPANPYHGMIYTLINRQNKVKYINGNGKKIVRKSGSYNVSESDSYTLSWYGVVNLIFDGKWYVIAEMNS